MCDIEDAIQVGNTWLKQSPPRDDQKNYWRMFSALLDLTEKDIKSGKPEECYYDYDEIAVYIQENFDGVKRSSVNRPALRTQIKELMQALDEHANGLSKIADTMGLNVIPNIAKKGDSGGHGKKVEISIQVNNANTIRKPESANSNPQSYQSIEYYLEAMPKLPFWSRWNSSIDFGDSKTKRILWAFCVITPLIALVGLCVAFALLTMGVHLPTGLTNSAIIISIVYIATYCLFFKHYIIALNNNIALMPDWMLPIRLQSAVLEVELNKPNDRQFRVKKLAVKVYVANCPICQHKVYLASGGLKYWGRIIGACDGNPVEHKFSFDHTTLQGKKLITL